MYSNQDDFNNQLQMEILVGFKLSCLKLMVFEESIRTLTACKLVRNSFSLHRTHF